MRIVQISDLHFTHLTWNPLRLLSKRLLGHLNWFFSRKTNFSYEPLKELPSLFQELNVDLILWGGDFTTTALFKEYEEASRFIQQFPQKAIAIPGNHDHYTYRSFREKHFYQFFSNPQTSPFTLKEHSLEIHPIAPHWHLIALDTARPTPPTSSRGLFSETLEEKLKHALEQIPKENFVILFNHYPFFEQEHSSRNLDRKEALRKILEETPQIRLYLHGHTHRHAVADLRPNQLPILLDSGCPVQKQKATWNLIDLLPDTCEVSAYHWEDSWCPFRKEKFLWQRS